MNYNETAYPTLNDLTDTLNVLKRSKQPYAYPFSLHLENELNGLISRFERCVWFAGFQAMNREASTRGFRFDTKGEGCIITFYSAGRVAVTMTKGDTSFTFVIDESASVPRSGMNSGASGNIDDLHAMMDEVIRGWRDGKRPKVDRKVGMGF